MKLIRDMTEPELAELFTHLARTVEAELPPGPSKKGKCLFALLVFDESTIGQYVSNANRSDIIKTLRETADRLERRQTIERVTFPS